MLGKDLYKIDNRVEITNDETKSLSIFYRPLLGCHSYAFYMNLIYTNTFIEYKEINELCKIMNISVDKLEQCLTVLNKYKLVKTLKSKDENKFIFIPQKPLGTLAFIKDDLYVRTFILKVGGPYFQEICASLNYQNAHHDGFVDVSKKLESDSLDSWTKEDESYLKTASLNKEYKINSIFDINYFLKDISNNLFPMKYRTFENLKEIASLADLYNVSYDKMRTYLPRVLRSDSNCFDLKLLRTLCISSHSDYTKIESNNYNVPCVLFLMNLQDGKEVTDYDKRILYNLANKYYLEPGVINVLIEHCLKNSDNRLIEKYVYQLASDLHRNDIKIPERAIERLDKHKNLKNIGNTMPNYEKIESENKDIDMTDVEQFLKDREHE